MATSSADLAIVLRMVDELSAPMQKAAASVATVADHAQRSAGPLGALASGLGNVVTTAAGFAIGRAITELPGQLTEAAKAAAEDAQSTVQLQRAVENAGQSWDVYGSQLQAVAENGIRLGFADEQTRQALSLLTAQTGSAEEAQRRLSLAQDLSRGTGMDLTTSARLLGKATDENANVLARYGIVMRKGADDTELFAAVQAKFGGQAEAFANSSAGAFAQFQLQLGEMQESLGNAVMPLLAGLATFANSTLVPIFNDQLAPALMGIGRTLGDVIGPAIEMVQGLFAAFTVDAGAMGIVIASIRRIFGDTVADGIEPFIQAFMRAIPEITAFASNVGGVLQGFANVVMDVLGGDIGLAFDDFREMVAWQGTDLIRQLQNWGQAFLSWIAPMIPPMLAQLGEMARNLADWIVGTGLPALVQAIGNWAGAFLDWVGPQIPPLLGQLGQLLTDVIGWIVDTGLPVLAANMVQWGEALIGWIAPRIPAILAALGEMLVSLGDWIVSTAAPAIGQRLLAWGEAFIAWIGPQIPPTLAALGELLSSIGNWIITDGVRLLAYNLVYWGKQFIQWIADVVPQIPGELAKLVQAIADWVSGPGGQQMASQGSQLASSVVQGFTTGITNLAGSVWQTMQTMAQNALAGARDALAAQSPSKKFIVLGQDVIAGLNLGILNDLSKTRAAGAQMGAELIGSARNAMVAANTDLTEYIKQSATQHGIDWQTALRVAMSEGGRTPGAVGDAGSSFGPFQLHMGGVAGGGNAVSGLGDSFKALTGLDPRDITTTWQQIDFAMSYAAQHGWGAWHGAAAAGISDWQGIGTAVGTANSQLQASDVALTTLSTSASTAGSGILSAMEAYASQANTIATDYQKQLVDLDVKTGDALTKNGQDAIDKMVGIVQSAQDEINRLGSSLAEPESYDARLRAEQDFYAAKQALRQGDWTADDQQRRLTRQLEDADRAYARAIDNENYSFQQNLAKAKTDAQRAQLNQQHADRLADLARQHTLGDQELKDSAKIAADRADEDKRVEAARAKWIKDNVETPLTEWKQTEIIKRRDADILAAQQAADANFDTISAEAEKERAKLLETARGKLADAKAEFTDKIGPLTAEQQDVIDTFLTNVEGAVSDTLGKIPASLGAALDQSVADTQGAVSKINDALGQIDTDIEINVKTNYETGTIQQGGATRAEGGGGAVGGYGTGAPGSGGTGVDMNRAETDQSYRANLRDAGYAVGRDDNGKLYVEKMALGGIVRRPTMALIGESGPEAVVPLGSGLGIDYDRLAAAMAKVTLVMSIDDVRTGLLRVGSRNGGIVGLT